MKPSLGMIVHTQKVMPILSSVLVLIGFSDLVCRDQPRGTPRGLRHPLGAPLVDPSTLGAKTLCELASLKYCYNVHHRRQREHNKTAFPHLAFSSFSNRTLFARPIEIDKKFGLASTFFWSPSFFASISFFCTSCAKKKVGKRART